ncbi:MAG TPA: hypothetical protein VGU45_01470 [Microvirga sp.]|jgi:hypothetical protein|nr:hypothetical protein [Microvirga sp.]
MTVKLQPGLKEAHNILVDLFEELAAEHDRSWSPWRRRRIILQTRIMKEYGARLVTRKKQEDREL